MFVIEFFVELSCDSRLVYWLVFLYVAIHCSLLVVLNFFVHAIILVVVFSWFVVTSRSSVSVSASLS